MKRILTGVHFKIRVSDFNDIISIDPRMAFYDLSFEYKSQLWPRRIEKAIQFGFLSEMGQFRYEMTFKW